MLEHLRREGWLTQLWGKSRPAIVALYAVAFFLVREDKFFPIIVFTLALIVLATLSFAQITLGRQRYPVFTKKAVMLTATAGLLTILIALAVAPTDLIVLLPVLVLLQPLTLTVAWLLLYPVDALLKNRIIARARRLREQHPDLTVIGVTGSVGKTTTKELLACMLKDLNPAVTPAHVNSEIGVAQWISSRLAGPAPEPGPDVLIVEMGAYRKGEISLMCGYVRPTLGVVTHVGTQHIALFGSQQNLFEAKAELIRSLPAEGRAFLNGDNELCRNMASVSPCPVVIVGTGGQCDLEAFDIEETPRGIRFRARDTVFDVPLHGTHNVSNVLLAIAVGEHVNVAFPRMRELLLHFTPLSQTFSVREEAGVKILDDTHNSSSASLKAAIAWARTQPEEHKVLLAAGLIEMGEFQSPAEQELGAFATQVFDRIIVIDPQSARNFAAGGAKNIEEFSRSMPEVLSGSLLICAGRMSPATIRKILPIHNS